MKDIVLKKNLTNKSFIRFLSNNIIKISSVTVIIMMLLFCMFLQESNMQSVADSSSNPQIKNVNLGIVGINNPEQPLYNTDYWSRNNGSYIYFGNYYQNNSMSKEPIKWRVLSNSNKSNPVLSSGNSLLLMSDKVLDVVMFNEDFRKVESQYNKFEKDVDTTYKANDYLHSNLRYWLNSLKDDKGNYLYENNKGYIYTQKGFLDEAFSVYQQNFINKTFKDEIVVDDNVSSRLNEDKIFLLSEIEASALGFGFYDSIVDSVIMSRNMEYTTYAKTRTPSIYNSWQLRTVTESNKVGYVQNGVVVYDEIEKDISGVCPALNLNTASIAYISESGLKKKNEFLSTTTNGENINEWNIAIYDGIGFKAEIGKSETNIVKPGNGLLINVSSIPMSTNQYTQISAMIVDDNNVVEAYGMISEKVRKGNIEVTIPYDLKEGKYTLRVFAEDINSGVGLNIVDYVSNFADIEIDVKNEVEDLQTKLQNERKLHHSIEAVLYDTDEYGEGGEGQKLTEKGIDIENWEVGTSKYLQVDVEVHSFENDLHTVRIKLPKELYFVNEVNAVPAGYSEVNFERNKKLSVNGGTMYYNLDMNSGTLIYYIMPNMQRASIQLEVRYDEVLWDKQKKSNITAEEIDPINISVNYEYNKGEYLLDGILKEVRVKSATSGQKSGKYIFYRVDTDKYDLTKDNSKDLIAHIIHNIQRPEKSYYQEGILEIKIPYWTDLNGKRYYLKYDINDLIIEKSTFLGNVNYDIIEYTESTIKIKVDNMYFTTQCPVYKIKFTYPDNIVTNQKLLTFLGGKTILYGKSVNGKDYTVIDNNIKELVYASKPEEIVGAFKSDKNVFYKGNNKRKESVSMFGGLYLENYGIVDSCEKTITMDFPEDLLVTTLNLHSDIKSEYIDVTYTLKDEDGNQVYFDNNGNIVKKPNKTTRTEWVYSLKNSNYNKNYLDNVYSRLVRDVLKEEHRNYYFNSVKYTIKTIRASSKMYSYASNHSNSGVGNYYGYLGKNVKAGTNLWTKVSIKSTEESNINDIYIDIRTYITNDNTVPYGIDDVKMSTTSITAGESVTVSGRVFVTAYPYGNNTVLDNIILGVILPKGVSFDKNDVYSETASGIKDKPKKVYNVDIGNGQKLWIIELDPVLKIGYGTENLQKISDGDTLRFGIKLTTERKMEPTTLFSDKMLRVCGNGVKNASGGSFDWASIVDKYDLNNNKLVTDRIGRMSESYTKECTIMANPPSLTITDSVAVTGNGYNEDNVAYLLDENDIVTYSLNIKSEDDGFASSFEYYIPIPKRSSGRDTYLVSSDKNSSFDMELVEPAQVIGDSIYNIDYTDATGLTYKRARELDEDSWHSLNNKNKSKASYTIMANNNGNGNSNGAEGNHYGNDKNNNGNNGNHYGNNKDEGISDLSEVTMIRLTLKKNKIEKGNNTTIIVKLRYVGNEFNIYAGQRNKWRSCGYYDYDTGTRVLSGHFCSPGCEAVIQYYWNRKEKISLIATSNKNPNRVNVVGNRLLEDDDGGKYSFPEFKNEQKYVIKDIKLNNISLKSKEYMKANQNTMSYDEADKNVAITIALKNGEEVDLNKGINQIVGTTKGGVAPQFWIRMYYGNNFRDTITNRNVEVLLEGNNGVRIYITIDIIFSLRNEIVITNGEECYYKPFDEYVTLFYAYSRITPLLNRDVLPEKDFCMDNIEFYIDKTNEDLYVSFYLGEKNASAGLGYYLDESQIIIYDEIGHIVQPKNNVYKLFGNKKYYIKFSDEYLNNLERGSKILYLYSKVSNMTSVAKVNIVRRNAFQLY